MVERLAFNRLLHSDWSLSPHKRWTATAVSGDDGRRIDSLQRSSCSGAFVENLFDLNYKTLAGFDFAIGLPSFYLDFLATNFADFISEIGDPEHSAFFSPAELQSDIDLGRPFYPRNSLHGPRQIHLTQRLGCTWSDLFRNCEMQTAQRGAASPLFWTLGAKQVGRATLSGWKEILIPAINKGAQVWPYDGSLADLSTRLPTIAETYPAEAYQHVGLLRTVSKRTHEGRLKASESIRKHVLTVRIALCSKIDDALTSGFGSSSEGEDPFDALVGLLSMIEVVEGRRAASPLDNLAIQKREGWILGQTDLPKTSVSSLTT